MYTFLKKKKEKEKEKDILDIGERCSNKPFEI
jgi:hypothetical protein